MGGGRCGLVKSTVLPSSSGLLHNTNPICPLSVEARGAARMKTKLCTRKLETKPEHYIHLHTCV